MGNESPFPTPARNWAASGGGNWDSPSPRHRVIPWGRAGVRVGSHPWVGSGWGWAEPTVKRRCGGSSGPGRGQGARRGLAKNQLNQVIPSGVVPSPAWPGAFSPGSPGQRGWQRLCFLSVDPEPGRANLYERHALRTCTWRSDVTSKCYNPKCTRKK